MGRQVAIKAIDNEYMITLITQIFEKFNRSNRYRDNRQVSTSLKSPLAEQNESQKIQKE